MSRGINWSEILGPLGLELDGYQETLKDCRDHPWTKPGKKAKPAKKKAGRKAKFPSAKHGSN